MIKNKIMAHLDKIIFSAIIAFIFFFAVPELKAQNLGDSFGSELNKIPNVTGYEAVDNPAEKLSLYIGGLIAWIGILGVLILSHLVLAGYEFITANGEEEKVNKAKRRIRSVIIAAVVLVSGLIVATFVTTVFSNITEYKG